MFFPRLRRQAKWMFVFLALVFAVGFVVFGVGSGGGGLGDVLNSLRGGSSSSSTSSLRERVQQNPRDAEARKDLATRLQQDGKTDQAIAVLQSYLALRPRDETVLSTVGSLYLQKANGAYNALVVAQRGLASTNPGQGLLPALEVNGQPIVPADPLGELASKQNTQRYDQALANLQGAYTHAIAAYKRLTKVAPKNPQYQLQLGQTALTGAQVGVTSAIKTAIAADEQFLKLAPDDPQVPQVKQQLKRLRQTIVQTQGG
jgi:tetratricopeptide (TPR) repeat protein